MTKLELKNSIGFRISALVAGVVMLGVCLIAGLFIARDFFQTIEAERVRLEGTTTAFAAASSDAVAKNDRSALYTVLRGISDVEQIKFISVKALDGSTIAEMGASVGLLGRDGKFDGSSLISIFTANTLQTNAPIWFSGEQIATLAIHADISTLRGKFMQSFILMVFVALASGLFIAIAAYWAINRALMPIKMMSGQLLTMGRNPDLTTRFSFDSKDEVGVLATAFNDAFETIHERNNAIRRHRDTLEITVQQRTEELKIAADDARQANAAKSDFLATMSHEIRTPMNGMLVMSELLAASNLSARQQRFAEVISRSGNSLLHIINDILDMSKIEAGKLELEEIPFSLATLIEDTVSLFAARAHEKSLQIGIVIAPEIAQMSIGDPTRLGQIISNLTNNALKFTETGGVLIRVAVHDQSEQQAITISVEDTGIGIAQEKLATIFEAFSQADQSTTRNYGGTGLGLSISKRLAEAMNGELSATSVEGKGTSFNLTLSLPVHEAPAIRTVPKQAFNVAVRNDNQVAYTAINDMLELAGLNVSNLETETDKPDLIICAQSSLSVLNNLDKAPIIASSDYGASHGDVLLNENVVGAVELPLGLQAVERIIQSLNQNDYSLLDNKSSSSSSIQIDGNYTHLKVLAVDDNAVNREVLGEALSALNVSAIFAESGQQAVEIAQQQPFDIIFMDCSMPGMDGYQATAAIRGNGLSKDAHIVALTAHVTGKEAERWKTAGMDHYIAKPFTVAQLSNVFEKFKSDELAVPSPETPVFEAPKDAILSEDVLSMFEMVSQTTGNDMRTKVFSMFIDKVGENLSALVDCYEEASDSKELKQLAHALKSMCSSAGAYAAQQICEEIESQASLGERPDTSIISKLTDTIELTITEMSGMLEAPNDQPEMKAQEISA
ncbi:hybrid sensor histidine kinase/response regulator [Ahrensia marina]|uniref:histidine kinase n=1 Tax=Ahrensia marina TaxID=1514904 RepID=A0A0N0E834_9HYPH|nr:hybrid sensor histidine kinase/response regulator [Ahrensia marina]KPB01875.1 hypothetical protein SU32_05775 [Ahrensia marina]